MNKILSKINISLCKPTSIHLSITNRCSLTCKHCDIWKKQQMKELSTEDVKSIISNLRDWLGPFTLNISGGEPFIRKDIFEIIKYSVKNEVEMRITTNGYLIDKKIAKKISESGLKSLNISLDGIKPETHDYIRNKKGCFKKVMNTINYLNKPNRKLCLVIATVFMGYNSKEIVPLVDWMEHNNLDGIIFQPIYSNFGGPYNPNWYRINEFWPKNTNEINKAINILIERKKGKSKIINCLRQLELFREYFKNPNSNTKLECRSGLKNYAINEKGGALLCFWLKPVGDNLKQKPKEIWESEEAKKRRLQIKKCNKNCKLLNCHFD